MKRWSKGTAIMVASLALGAGPVANTQPTPFGPARMPEPTPYAVSQPPLAPGPMTALDAPPGPPSSLSLPANHAGAFQSEDFATESVWFFHGGTQAYKRQGLGNFNLGATTGSVGVPAQNLHNLNPNWGWGPCGTIGYLFGDSVIELGFYGIPENSKVQTNINALSLNPGFINAPTGFTDLFTNADRLSTTFSSHIWSTELNYRYSDIAVRGTELILGIRYVDQGDKLSVMTDRDALTTASQLAQATYQVSTTNHFLAPQVGFEWERKLCKWLSTGMVAKGAWGVNFAEVQDKLYRGDGVRGFDIRNNDPVFSHLYEMNFFLELHLLERLKLRGGYNFMWLCQWATGPSNFTSDLNAPQTNPNFNHDGSIFYQGPQFELQFLF